MMLRTTVFGRYVECAVCGQQKKPIGRDSSRSLCDDDCRGYDSDPKPGDLWPGESEKEFGCAVGPHGLFMSRGE